MTESSVSTAFSERRGWLYLWVIALIGLALVFISPVLPWYSWMGQTFDAIGNALTPGPINCDGDSIFGPGDSIFLIGLALLNILCFGLTFINRRTLAFAALAMFGLYSGFCMLMLLQIISIANGIQVYGGAVLIIAGMALNLGFAIAGTVRAFKDR
jgi:hypothetical protein